jgi:hypothetical protein
MMELFIQIRNGQPFEHPIFGDNFRQAFPDIDVNNLPPEFAKFERVERPMLGVYQAMIQDDPTYELVDGIWKDVWHVRDMTAEEKTITDQKIEEYKTVTIQAAKDAWAALPNRDNFTAWTFDEATLRYLPPIPRPEGDVAWDGTTNTWKERATRPDDGKPYKWDIPSWSWVEVI